MLRERIGGAQRCHRMEAAVSAARSLHLRVAETAAGVKAQRIEGVDVVLKLNRPGFEAVALRLKIGAGADVVVGPSVGHVGRPVSARIVAHAGVPGAVVLHGVGRIFLAVVHVLPAHAAVYHVFRRRPGTRGGQRQIAALRIVDRDRRIEKEHVRERNVGAVEGHGVRADLGDRKRERAGQPHIVAAHREARQIACAHVHAGIAERPAGKPLIAHHRFDAVIGVDEVHEEERAFVAAAVDQLTADAHAEGEAVFLGAVGPLPRRMVGVGGNDPDAAAVFHDGFGTSDGILPEGAEVAGAVGGFPNKSGGRRIDDGFKERSGFGLGRQSGKRAGREDGQCLQVVCHFRKLRPSAETGAGRGLTEKEKICSRTACAYGLSILAHARRRSRRIAV